MLEKVFPYIAKKASFIVGHALTFFMAFLLVVTWLVTGPLFKYSDTWQLVMNTISSVVTFLIVFLLQNSQNRFSDSVEIKLDELIKVNKKAKNELLDLDQLTDEQMEEMIAKYKEFCKTAPPTHHKK